MRKGFDRLAALVKRHGGDVFSGHLFAFVSRRRDRIKILTWDNGGFVLFYKRLDQVRRARDAEEPVSPGGDWRPARAQASPLDLALAVAVLAAVGKAPLDELKDLMVLGELSLDGSLQPLRGVLPHLHGVFTPTPREEGRCATVDAAIVPAQHAAEAGLVGAAKVLLAHNLKEVVDHLHGRTRLGVAAQTPFERGEAFRQVLLLRAGGSIRALFGGALASRHAQSP